MARIHHRPDPRTTVAIDGFELTHDLLRSFTLQRDIIPAVTLHDREPDPDWVYEDSVGHVHWAVREEGRYGWVKCSYPTLQRRTKTVVDDHCDDYCDCCCTDKYEITFYACPMCGEEISPSTRPASNRPRHVSGPMSITVEFISDRWLEWGTPFDFTETVRVSAPGDRVQTSYVAKRYQGSVITADVEAFSTSSDPPVYRYTASLTPVIDVNDETDPYASF